MFYQSPWPTEVRFEVQPSCRATSPAEKDRALALLSGQQARADAASLRAAMAGVRTSERAIKQALEGKTAPERVAIETEYR